MPVTAPLSASVTLSSPPAGGLMSTRLDTSEPTAPTGGPASSFSAASTGVAPALSTGASLVFPTAILNMSDTEALLSLAVTFTAIVPTSPAPGVPENVRVVALNDSQPGSGASVSSVAV